MTRYIARFIFLCALFIMKKRIAKAMWKNADYYVQTMLLIDSLWDKPQAFAWQTRANNLMLSYKGTFK